MDISIVIDKIINIPKDFHQLNKSVNRLVIESGYLEICNQVTEYIILQALEKQPERIDEWIMFSEDQRVLEGEFLKTEGNGFFVSSFSAKEGYKETLIEYPDVKTACAAFIKCQIENSRELTALDSKTIKKR